MRIYMGFRIAGLCHVFHWDAESPSRPQKLNPRYDLHSHSPAGFEWAYGGSGPAQLALALVAHALVDDERALAIYQDFKWSIVGRLPRDCWSMTRDSVLEHVQALELGRFGKREVKDGDK